MTGRLGDIQVAHATLARFPIPPQRNEKGAPLFDIISEINNSIPSNCETVIDKIDIISTTRMSYVWTEKHVYISPPVSLTGNQSHDQIRFLKPKQRRESTK